MSKLENKPSEKILRIFKKILEGKITIDKIPEKYQDTMLQAIIIYLDEQEKS